MIGRQRSTPFVTSESVGAFYDQMGAFFAALFGEDIHFGIWGDNDASSMSEAQTRMTDLLIDLLQLQHDEHLLDVGCGTGHPAIRLTERTEAKILGVSVSPAQVKCANAKIEAASLSSKVRFMCADGMKLPCESEMFDAAWAIEVLFHVPDRGQVLSEIRRTLKPGGRVVLTDFVERVQLSNDEWDLLAQGFAFSSLLDPENYCEVIFQSGLEVIRLLDITAQTRPNIDWIQSRYDDNKEGLAAHYGADFAVRMDQLLPIGMSIYREKLGYVIIEARRPPSGTSAFSRG